MKLNGYNGGAIEAAGKLNVSYEGNNTVTNDNAAASRLRMARTRTPSLIFRRRVQHAQRDIFS